MRGSLAAGMTGEPRADRRHPGAFCNAVALRGRGEAEAAGSGFRESQSAFWRCWTIMNVSKLYSAICAQR